MGKRSTSEIALHQPDDFVQFIMNDFFAKEGFVFTQYKGENVWKKGVGILSGPQFIKTDYQNGILYIQAWIKYAILPGVYVGEMPLEGFFGFAIKQSLKSRVNELIRLLQQPIEAPVGQQAPSYNAPPSPQPIPVKVHDPSGKADIALVLGILSAFAWLIPILGILVTGIGISQAIPGRRSSKRGRATAGLVLSIVFLVFSILNWLWGILMVFL